MLRFKASTCIFTAQGATLQNEPQVCICDRRPRLTAKRFQNGRPACSPESPDFMRRLQANELRLERRSELFLPAFFIGGAKGLGTSPLHGLKSKRQVVLVQAVRKQGVMIFQSWQLPVRVLQRPSTCWAKKFSKTMPKAEVANPGPESGKTCQFASIL
nr:uncharacterized protein LOC125990304 isoform X31 [Syngnathus scovelli]XP_049613297.1 uncharacterized protein LOC125990304 isoform X32 [Syngnathus scovelli]